MKRNRPTIKQLRYFLGVCEAGSYRRAAERMGVSQPTLTAQIAGLETALGVRLLERSRGGTSPTPIGRDMVPRARRVLSEVEALIDAADVSRQGPSGTHRLGVPPTLGPYFLPNLVPELHRRYPALKLYVRESAPRELELELMEGRHDFILTPLPVTAGGVVVDRLFEESLRVVVPEDHPFASKKSLKAEDLQGETILALEEKHHLYGQARALSERLGANLRRDYEGTSLDTLRQMVGMGMGIAFLPALYVRSEISPRKSEVAVLELEADTTLRTVGLAWRSHAPNSRLYREVAGLIRDVGRREFADVIRIHDANTGLSHDSDTDVGITSGL